MCLLQREDLETKEDRKKVRETAQRTGKFENNKERKTGEGRNHLRKPNAGVEQGSPGGRLGERGRILTKDRMNKQD